MSVLYYMDKTYYKLYSYGVNMHNHIQNKVVSYKDNKVLRRKGLTTLTVFLTTSKYIYGIDNHHSMKNTEEWNCRSHIQTNTMHNILKYMQFIDTEAFVVSFNMDHMVEVPNDLVVLINNILTSYPKSFVFINSTYGYAPQIFQDVRYKGKVSLTLPQNTTCGKRSNKRYFTHQAKSYGFVTPSKARHIVSGHPLVIPHPEVEYDTGETKHVHASAMQDIDTNFMVCNSGIYINPDGAVCSCINDIYATDKRYMLGNVNSKEYVPLPKVTMCKGLGCPGVTSKYVRSLELFAKED